MFSRWVIRGSALSLFSFLFSCSTSIRVYRPYPLENPYELVVSNPNVTVLTPDTQKIRFALYDPVLFRVREPAYFSRLWWVVKTDLLNEYGNLDYLIRKEISIRAGNYPNLQKEKAKIEVTEFKLESVDSCYKNQVSVRFLANVQIGRQNLETFEYNDKIDSFVGDCYLFGSIITLIPLIWYVPYNGFRGNREDQLNQLGRNAMEAFFSFLEIQSGFTQNHIKPKIEPQLPPDPVRDPKVKEIMEDL